MEEFAVSRIPVLFCHVPCAGKPFSVSEMTKFFEQLVGELVDYQDEFVYYTPPRSPTGEILS
jgi:hypothetical protein